MRWGAPDSGDDRLADQAPARAPTVETITPATPAPAPEAEEKPAPLPEPSRATPAPVPATPPPAPPLDRSQQLKIAVGEAAEYEAASDWKHALMSSIHLVKDFPEYDKGPSRLDSVVEAFIKTGTLRRSFEEMYPLIEQASDLGSGSALMAVADHARKNDPAGALSHYLDAADKGVARAMTQIGQMYLHGEGVPTDVKAAETWFGKASAHNDPSGTFALAECYLTGRGVKQDKTKAVALLMEASDHKSGDAKNLLGKLNLNGEAGFQVNKLSAAEYFRQAKDLNCPEAFYNLGVLNMTARGPQAGRYPLLFKRGAELGNSLCMFYYAKCLEGGDGFPASQPMADTWYTKAIEPLKVQAEARVRPAMYCYAQCLEGGKGVPRDPVAAATWYSKAASAGENLAIQWCIAHKVDFKVTNDAQTPSKLTLPHRVSIGTSPDRKLP
jgi:TPR repeat protein